MAIQYGDLVTCNFDSSTPSPHVYNFSGVAGDIVRISASFTDFGNIWNGFTTYPFGQPPTIELWNPAGNKVASQQNNGYWDTQVVAKLSTSGVYTIRVTYGVNAGNNPVGLSLERVTPPSDSATSISLGQTLGDEINPRPDVDLFAFNGTSGSTIKVTISRRSGNQNPEFQLYDPTGVMALSGSGTGTATGTVTLLATGKYAISVRAREATETMPYSINVACTSGCPPSSPGFVPVAPCRVIDTRPVQGITGDFGPPSMIAAGTRSFPIPQGRCSIPTTAQAYSVNVTVVPESPLGYLSMWPTGQVQPLVSTLNSPEGNIVANAAIVPAGNNGAISIYTTDPTDVVVDINGYFDSSNSSTSYAFYAATPCRVFDTRNGNGPFGGPIIGAGQSRSFQVPASACSIPASATAFSTNVTVVPSGPLGYLTLWPTGQTQPLASTLNSPAGRIVANAAITPAGSNGAVSVFVTDQSHVLMDVNGYFAPPGNAGALTFVPVTPCRIMDTRNAVGTFGGPVMQASSQRAVPVPSSGCGIPASAKAYSLNVTVVPQEPLGYLSIWPTAQAQPFVSTLNSPAGQIVANAAIVPADANGSISVFVTNRTHVILDINGYFAP